MMTVAQFILTAKRSMTACDSKIRLDRPSVLRCLYFRQTFILGKVYLLLQNFSEAKFIRAYKHRSIYNRFRRTDASLPVIAAWHEDNVGILQTRLCKYVISDDALTSYLAASFFLAGARKNG